MLTQLKQKSTHRQRKEKVLRLALAFIIGSMLTLGTAGTAFGAQAANNNASTQVTVDDQAPASDHNAGGLQVGLENKQVYHYTDNTERPEIIRGNLQVLSSLEYDDPSAATADPFHANRIKVDIDGYFDLSTTGMANMLSMSTCGSSWMALMKLPPHLDSDNFIKGIEKAYADNPDAFTIKMFNGDLNPATRTDADALATMNFDGTKFIKPFTDVSGTTVDPDHTLEMTGRGDALQGKWDAFWNIYKNAHDLSDIYTQMSFYIDVNAATANGLVGEKDSYLDASPDAYLTKNILPPADNGVLQFNVEFYDYSQVASSYLTANKEIHVITDQYGYPKTQVKTTPIDTWCYYMSPWDSLGYYNSVPNTIGDVTDDFGVMIPQVLPSVGYLQPYIDHWNPDMFGDISTHENMMRFARAVNIMHKRLDVGASKAMVPTGVQQGQTFVITYKPSTDPSIINPARSWDSLFRNPSVDLRVGNYVGDDQ